MAITFIRIMLVASVLLLSSQLVSAAQQCSYSTWSWNVTEKRAVAYRQVVKNYSELQAYERDRLTGCSICEQDQAVIQLPGIKSFKVCKLLAQDLKDSLQRLIINGVPVKQVVGYRVGLTRGPIDPDGNRTRFSNHSFGVAIDINPKHNGLYTNCFQFGPQCKRIRGGHWRPHQDPFSLKPDGNVVKALQRIGLKWGGRIQGRQKDFMHFSITGY